MLLVAPMVAQLFVLPVWGKATDRMGKKPVLIAASIGLVPAGLGWCCTTGGNPWLGYLLSAAGAALWTGVDVANFNFVLEMSDGRGDGAAGAPASSAKSPSAGGSAYAAVNSVIVNVAGCLGGLSAGYLAESLHDWAWQPVSGWKTFSFYDVLFALSGVLRLAAVVIFIPFLQEPGARSTLEAVRFMTGMLCNNLCGFLLQPLRLVARWRPASAGGAGEAAGGVEAAEPAAGPAVAWDLLIKPRVKDYERARLLLHVPIRGRRA